MPSNMAGFAPDCVQPETDANFFSNDLETKLAAIAASSIIGLVGILPLFILPLDYSGNLAKSTALRVLLGFACGGLLGDVFIHLLPETLRRIRDNEAAGIGIEDSCLFNPEQTVGIWIIIGILVFFTLEKAVTCVEEDEEETTDKKTDEVQPKVNKVDPSGYVNLVLNTLDNFTHGLAIAASFCVSMKVGILSSLAIILHEIPHEIGDFAILVKSGFSKKAAIVSQLSTSIGGVIGTLVGLTIEGVSHSTLWILPFTAGGFIYVAIGSLIPDFREDNLGMAWYRDVLHVTLGAILVGSTAFLE